MPRAARIATMVFTSAGSLVEDVPDREALELHGRFVASGPLELVRPQRAGDVGQNAGAIAFAVDDARAVRERRHAMEHELEDRARRLRVLPRYRDQRTGIVLARHVSSSALIKKPPALGRPSSLRGVSGRD